MRELAVEHRPVGEEQQTVVRTTATACRRRAGTGAARSGRTRRRRLTARQRDDVGPVDRAPTGRWPARPLRRGDARGGLPGCLAACADFEAAIAITSDPDDIAGLARSVPGTRILARAPGLPRALTFRRGGRAGRRTDGAIALSRPARRAAVHNRDQRRRDPPRPAARRAGCGGSVVRRHPGGGHRTHRGRPRRRLAS